jgi:hypothetical protein
MLGADPGTGCDTRYPVPGPEWIWSLSDCIDAFGASPECQAHAAQLVALWQQPYWGLTVPVPGEIEGLNWVVNYGYLDGSYVPEPWRDSPCAVHTASPPGMRFQTAPYGAYGVPFAQWLRDMAAAGRAGVIASRSRRTEPDGTVVFAVEQVEYYAPPVVEWPARYSLGTSLNKLFSNMGMPFFAAHDAAQAVMALADVFYSVALAIEQGRLGYLSDVQRDWMVIYAPKLQNAPTGILAV